MMADWNVGDKACCVNTGLINHGSGYSSTGKGLVMFKIYDVIGFDWNEMADKQVLYLADDPTGTMGRLEERFIRIPPKKDSEKGEVEKQIEFT